MSHQTHAALTGCIGFSLALLTGTGAMAQPQAPTQDPTQAALKQAALADPTGTATLQNAQPTIILESAEEGTFLKGKIGFETNRPETNLSTILELRAPFDQSKKEVGFLNLDGLTGGTAASLSLTLQGNLPPIGQPITLESVCDEANQAIKNEFLRKSPVSANVRECPPQNPELFPILFNRLEEGKAAALWGLCQEANRKRSSGLLAPPDSSNLPSGYSENCSPEALIRIKKGELEKEIDSKALTKVIDNEVAAAASARPQRPVQVPQGDELQRQIAPAREQLILEACKEFNKNRSQSRLFTPSDPPKPPDPPTWFGSCSLENLAEVTVREEVEKKQKEAVALACRNVTAVPIETLFVTGQSALNNCFLTTLLDFAEKTPNPAYWQRKALKAIPPTLWYFTLKGTRTDQTFKYLDKEMDFKAQTVRSDSTSVGLSASIFTRGLLFTVGGDQQRRFTASPALEVCTPILNTTGLACQQAALAGPARKDVEVVRGEFRTILNAKIGLGLRSLYDTDNSEWEHHVLLHFLRNLKEGLNGGIDLQYNTNALAAGASDVKGDHFTARLFVGVKFGLPFLPGNPPTQAP